MGDRGRYRMSSPQWSIRDKLRRRGLQEQMERDQQTDVCMACRESVSMSEFDLRERRKRSGRRTCQACCTPIEFPGPNTVKHQLTSATLHRVLLNLPSFHLLRVDLVSRTLRSHSEPAAHDQVHNGGSRPCGTNDHIGDSMRQPFLHESWKRLLMYSEKVDETAPASRLAFGSTTTLLVTEDDSLHVAGFDPGDGRLGIGDHPVTRWEAVNGSTFMPVSMPDNAAVAHVSAGSEHAVVISSSGTVFSWGAALGDLVSDSRPGKLGHGECEDVYTPRQVGDFEAVWTGCGSHHSLLVQAGSNQLFSCGGGMHHELGHPSGEPSLVPTLVASLAVPVLQVAAGSMHTVLVDYNGVAYTCGHGAALGLGEQLTATEPQVLDVAGFRVKRVAAGDRHSAVLTSDGQLWCCGENEKGQCGTDSAQVVVPVPSKVILWVWNPSLGKLDRSNERLIQVEAGATHTVVLTFETYMFTMGDCSHGRLGTGQQVLRKSCPAEIVSLLRGKVIVQIAAGGGCSGAITADGEVFVWGSGGSGQLGQGNWDDHDIPIQLHHQCSPTLNLINPDESERRDRKCHAELLMGEAPMINTTAAFQ